MSDLVVIAFPTEAKAEEVRQKLLAMQKEYLIELGDAVIAVKDDQGHIKLNQLINTTAIGAVGGTFWGALIGLIFLMPLAGAAIGAASGAIAPRPDAIATYCLPLTSKVIGGALNPEPRLVFHISASVVSSKAATVPSARPRKIRPPAVAKVPLTLGYGRWAFFLISPVMGSTAVKLLSSRSATCLPPFQPFSFECISVSIETSSQPVRAGT